MTDGRTRRERQLETRERLLKAAAQVFARRGHAAATVSEVAQEAGYSTGAVYSNFAGKDELFLALMERTMQALAQQRAAVAGKGTDVRDRAGTAARQWLDFLRQQPDSFVLLIEFWTYAVRYPDVSGVLAERLAEARKSLAALLMEAGDGDVAWAERSPDDVALAMQALAFGFALQHLAAPADAPEESFASALEWLFAGARPQ